MTASLQDLLDAFLNGDSPPEVFLSELSVYCDATPNSSWEVLALLDQYHRRGKLSADHFRSFRRKIEFRALGIADPPVAAAPPQPVEAVEAKSEVEAEAAASLATGNDEELQALRAALEAERERSQRYKHRIATLSEFGRQHRSISRSRAPAVAPQPVPAQPAAPPPDMPLVIAPKMVNTSAKVRARRGKALVALWLAQHRRLQHPRTWSYAAVMLAAATVIASSSSNLGLVPDAPVVATTPVVFEPAPQLPVGFLEPRTVSLSRAKFVVLPGNSMAAVQVERTGDVGNVVQFKWWTQSAGAKSGQDFVGKSQIAQFESGQTSVQLPVRILANPRRRHTEMFYVVLGEPEGEATLGDNGRAAVFIMRTN